MDTESASTGLCKEDDTDHLILSTVITKILSAELLEIVFWGYNRIELIYTICLAAT